jgi:protein involved in polysaccharide export with SLBB domain
MPTLLRFARLAALLCAGACAAPASPSRSVVVSGAVEHAGTVLLAADATLLEVVLLASPTAGVADLSRVELRRPDPPLDLTIDVESMLLTGDTTWNVSVQPADRVHVPSLSEEEL